MSQIVHKDGIVLNGRRYNHPALQTHLYEVVETEQQGNNKIAVSIEGVRICIAEAQNPIISSETDAGEPHAD